MRPDADSFEANEAARARAVEHSETERRLRALASLVAGYETERGTITVEEMAKQDELDRDAAAATRARTRRSE